MNDKKSGDEDESHTDDTLPLDSGILKDVYTGKIKLKKSLAKVEHIGPLGDLNTMIQFNNTYFHEYMIFSNTIRSMINVIDVDSLPQNDMKMDSDESEGKMSVSFAALPDIIINYNRVFFGEYDENPYVCTFMSITE
ncbi:Hypothetical protein SRAE_1000127300 [Strongyloides ratti]|uniref:Uncharacterized protein n=1 Tax=Strongyloides ratti TaxID=34506 RepID=A0A090L4F8_STRRB|nr:Hypothetical protein SRAE_1000127300 [Strongyloides ratti]CEF63007.1 Hypothetical protein SRAE_1000127300 [Strongyloides ratti]